MRIGLIARADKTGLGNQTRNLAYMLKPSKVLVIDSSPFNHNKQYFETFNGFNSYKVVGFPTNRQVISFMRNIDVLISCETFYNQSFVTLGKRLGIRTFLQYNYEFLDYLNTSGLTLPTKLISPSYWNINEVQSKFGNVVYLPPPTDHRLFNKTRQTNFNRDGKKFLHILGRAAVNDRNGTMDLIKSLEYTDSNFELVIKTQTPLPFHVNDNRVTIDSTSPIDETDLYLNFDAMILPRRYAGLCLPMNEALMSGLPVIMTDIEPNNKILPKKWLVESKKQGSFYTRTDIDYYSADHKELAKKLDWLVETDLSPEKAEAFEIGYNNYSVETLKPQYDKVLSDV